MRPVGFSGRARSLEWMRAPDYPQRRAPSFWPLQIGGWTLYGLATAVSYIPFRHMREAGGLPGRSPLFNVFGQLRSVCLLSFPLAPFYPVSFCPVFYQWDSRTFWAFYAPSSRLSLRSTWLSPRHTSAGVWSPPEHSKLRSFSSHGAHFTSGSSITVPSRSRGRGCWSQKRRRVRLNFRRSVINCSLIFCLTP